jgi:hypothetical protein
MHGSSSTTPLLILPCGVLKWLEMLHGLLVIFKLIPNLRVPLRRRKNLGWWTVLPNFLFLDYERRSNLLHLIFTILKIRTIFHSTLFLDLSFPLIFRHVLLEGQLSHKVGSILCCIRQQRASLRSFSWLSLFVSSSRRLWRLFDARRTLRTRFTRVAFASSPGKSWLLNVSDMLTVKTSSFHVSWWLIFVFHWHLILK